MSTLTRTLITIVTLVACSLANAEQQNKEIYLEDFYCAHGSYSLHLPETYAALRTIGKLKGEIVTSTEDWDDYKTIDKELIFDGLVLYVVTFTNDPNKYAVLGAKITGRHWKLTNGFKVGDLINEVKKLNTQVPLTAKTLNFGGDTDSLAFKLSHGRITAIEYGCYSG